MSAAPLLRPRSGVLSRAVDDEMVLLDLRSERYLGLNASGARMWALATTAGDRDVIVAALVADFPGVSAEQLAADFDSFVAKVRAAGLVEE